jgi:hypothetical protein
MRVYANAGLPLTYLGWTEDVAGHAVIAPKLVAPIKAAAAAVKKVVTRKYTYVTLPQAAGTWGIYRLNVQPVVRNIFARLNPGKYGPLTYKVERWTVPNQVAVITTRDFGPVQIYVAPGTGAYVFTK